MDRDRNDLVKQVFQEALEKGDEAERRAFVASACGKDEQARDRVMALLGAYAGVEGFLTAGRGGHGPEAVGTEVDGAGYVGTRIGPYKVLELIGEGGFGTVYMAEQQDRSGGGWRSS